MHLDQHAAYAEAQRCMLMHTAMAAIAMALGPFQFIASVRSRVPHLHRMMGNGARQSSCPVGGTTDMLAGGEELTAA